MTIPPAGDPPPPQSSPDKMTASDSSPPPQVSLSSDTIDRLRAALTDFAGGAAHDDDLRAALRLVSADARARVVPPEEVLVQLKRLWHALPARDPRRGAADDTPSLQRVVTMCIEEYYR